MLAITSRENPRLKFARRVRDGKEPEFIFIEGARLTEEAIRSRIPIIGVFFTEEFLSRRSNADLVDSVVGATSESFTISDKLAASVADTENSQGVFVVANRPRSDVDSFNALRIAHSTGIFVHLAEVNNPSNLGAAVRTAEAAGVVGVITGPRSADAYSPKSLRAAMGSAFRMPIWEKVTLSDAVEWAKTIGLTTTAADKSGKLSYTKIDWRKPRLLVFGSEAHGLSDEELRLVQDVIYIRLENGVESLNLAVSSGVILFEALRQRSA